MYHPGHIFSSVVEDHHKMFWFFVCFLVFRMLVHHSSGKNNSLPTQDSQVCLSFV